MKGGSGMLDAEFMEKSRAYDKAFESYYREWFKNFEPHNLVRHEQILCDMIDSDLVAESLLMDEVMKMREFIHDECLRRVALSCKSAREGVCDV